MQNVKTIEPLISIYDLESLPEDGSIYELFEGELSVAKTLSLKHQDIIGNFETILNNYLC